MSEGSWFGTSARVERMTASLFPILTFNLTGDLPPADLAIVEKKWPNATKTPTGLRYVILANPEPKERVSARLLIEAGAVHEADDQQGLAHFIEHMAFNGSAHFKPGELVSYFEATGARLGPHVNAYTSFDETVYMLDLPTDSGDVVSKGVQALADFGGVNHVRAGADDGYTVGLQVERQLQRCLTTKLYDHAFQRAILLLFTQNFEHIFLCQRLEIETI